MFHFPIPNFTLRGYPAPPTTQPTSSSTTSRTWTFGRRSPPPPPSYSPPPPYYGYGGYGSPWLHYSNPYYNSPWTQRMPGGPPMDDFGYATGFGGIGMSGNVRIGGNSNRNNGGDDGKQRGGDGGNFEAKLNVSKYKPEELSVRTINNTTIIVEGRKNKQGDYTSSTREFEQRYTLPNGIPPENLTCALSSDGFLTLSAIRPTNNTIETNLTEKNVNITTTTKEEETPKSNEDKKQE